jgi:hypothetical protein
VYPSLGLIRPLLFPSSGAEASRHLPYQDSLEACPQSAQFSLHFKTAPPLLYLPTEKEEQCFKRFLFGSLPHSSSQGFGASGSLYLGLASVERCAVYSKESQSICFRNRGESITKTGFGSEALTHGRFSEEENSYRGRQQGL